MACPHSVPVFSKDKSHKLLGRRPCGKCTNCIVDTRNRYVDEGTEELVRHGGLASYVTFTFDELHLDRVLCSDNRIRATIDYQDIKKFHKRIRRYLETHGPSVPGLSREFKFLACCEYGEKNVELPRPHWHVIYFGLDYRMAAKMFRECWRFGQIDVKPVKDGCIRYVTSYLSKQVKSKVQPRDSYESKGIRRPKVIHSRGLGKSLYYRNLEFIKSHDGCYLTKGNKLRPIPQYYRYKFNLFDDDYYQTSRDKFEKCNERILRATGKNGKVFNLRAYNAAMQSFAIERETILISRLTAAGEPVPQYWQETAARRKAAQIIEIGFKKYYRDEYASAIRSYGNLVEKYSFVSPKSKVFTSSECRNMLTELALYGDVVPF